MMIEEMKMTPREGYFNQISSWKRNAVKKKKQRTKKNQRRQNERGGMQSNEDNLFKRLKDEANVKRN